MKKRTLKKKEKKKKYDRRLSVVLFIIAILIIISFIFINIKNKYPKTEQELEVDISSISEQSSENLALKKSFLEKSWDRIREIFLIDKEKSVDEKMKGELASLSGDELTSIKKECNDSLDNDKDNLIDEFDPGCWNSGCWDYIADIGCYNSSINNESKATLQCQDGIDNDNDGLIDTEDLGCVYELDNNESGYPKWYNFNESNITYIEICSPDELNNTRKNLSANYKLICNIDLTNYLWLPIEGEFSGFFNGNGHYISNLLINCSGISCGFFKDSSGYIKNIHFNNLTIYSSETTGGIVASLNYGGIIKNSSTRGNLFIDSKGKGLYKVGGLVGHNLGTIYDSFSIVNIYINSPKWINQIGGLVGANSYIIENSYASGNISGGSNDVGGLVGLNAIIWRGRPYNSFPAIIKNSYSTGNVLAEVDSSWIGGLVGSFYGYSGKSIAYAKIINSSSIGNVNGTVGVGGLVGFPFTANKIINSHAHGNVSGRNDIGGLVGFAVETEIINSYATGNVEGLDGLGGLVGYMRGNLKSTYSTGNVYSFYDYRGRGCLNGNVGSCAGGLVGIQSGRTNITNSYATGNVTARTCIGGLIGFIYPNSSIINSYSTGKINSTIYSIFSVGGLVGFKCDNFSFALDSYYNTNTSGKNQSALGQGKTTNEMKLKNTYLNWDFNNIWYIDEGNDYPKLKPLLLCSCEVGQVCQDLRCVEDSRCKDKDRDGIFDFDANKCSEGKDVCVYTNSSYFKENPDKVNDYMPEGVDKTKINKDNILDFENFTLASGNNKIIFKEKVKLVRVNESGCFEKLNFTSFIKINKTHVFVNSSYFSELNKPAKLIFSNVSFVALVIYRDGNLCSLCNITNYINGSLEVDVPGFSEYEIREGPFCGDSFCNGQESCSSCPGDCGNCPQGTQGPPAGGPGSSSGSSSSSSSGSSGGIGSLGTPSQIPAASTQSRVTCTENWNCSEWSDCINKKQTKTCIDLNNCGSENNKPETEKDCEQPKKKNLIFFYFTFIGSIVIIILVIIYFLIKVHNKREFPEIVVKSADSYEKIRQSFGRP